MAQKQSTEAETKAWRRSHFPQDVRDRYDQGVQAATGRASDMGWDVGVLDLDERTRLLDADGVAAEVIFPDNSRRNAVPFRARDGGLAGSLDEMMEGSRSYNRWLADYCSASPHRRIGVALVHVLRTEDALAEVRWAVNAGMRGIAVTISPDAEGLPPYSNAYYDPLWAGCEEMEVPVHTHGGRGGGHAILEQLILSGVFHRYPRLRAVWTEQGADWIAPMLAAMDARHDRDAGLRGRLPLRPSEYWARNCWVGHSTRHVRQDWELRSVLGAGKMMWGSDFPHPEGIWPYTAEALQVCFSGVPAGDLRRIAGETAAAMYKIDTARLAAIAARIGPEISRFAA
ncbi:MAG: amidohydrolase [Dehalococcoidia bacterium]|nr:amidohydrolase [Dehalococcoidia bacterium]